MKIEKFERYEEKLNNILNELDNFCMGIEESRNNGDDSEIDEIKILKIKNIETSAEDKGKATKKKLLVFCMAVQFVLNDQINLRENTLFHVNF